MRCAVGRDEHVNLATQQVRQDRAAAFVGHMQHGGVHLARHVFAHEVVQAAGAHAGIAHRLAFFGHFARISHQFFGVVGREVLARRDSNGRLCDFLHQTEVFRLVFDGFQGQRGQNQFVGRALKNVIPVSWRIEHLLGRDGAARTAQVFNDDGLLELGGQRHVDLAGNDVGQAARRVRHHQGDGFIWVGLGLSGGGRNQSRTQQPTQGFERIHVSLHIPVERWRDARLERRQPKDNIFSS